MKKKETNPDAIPGMSSATVAIATFIATGDRGLARRASKRFGAELGTRTFDSLTFDEVFDFLEAGG